MPEPESRPLTDEYKGHDEIIRKVNTGDVSVSAVVKYAPACHLYWNAEAKKWLCACKHCQSCEVHS